MREIVFGIAMLLVSVASVAAAEAGQISVSGYGSVETQPDMATISLGVVSESSDATQAMEDNSSAVARVIEQIKSAGIVPADIQTSDLSLSPLWNRNGAKKGEDPRIVGYSVSNQLTVRIRDLPSMGGVLDAVVQNGGNRFYGLSFGLQNPRPMKDEARQRAVADAIRKAKLYADAAGVSLGEIVQLSELSAARPQPFRSNAIADAVPIAESEVSIDATVTIIFAIKQ